MNPSEKARKIEQLLEEKTFDQLTREEQEVVLHEFGSEEQYALARKIGQALVNQKTGLSPDPWVLASLQDQLHARRRPSTWFNVVHMQVPAYVMVCSCLIVVAVMWWLKPNEVAPAIVRVLRDTVYVASQADTVYQNKIIYRYVRVTPPLPKATNVISVAGSTKSGEAPSEGVTMKDKEELEKLLVSGSD